MDKKKLSPSIEDYLEAIYFLAREKKSVRTSDIASFLGHRIPSVTEMLGKLNKSGLVKHEKYGAVLLTPRGRRIAKKVSDRHVVLVSFLRLLGVNKKSAEIDACKIEHVVNSKTMDKLRKFVRFARGAPETPIWLKHFRHFVKTGKRLECECREKS